MIIDSIRTYFLGCPLLENFAKLNVDFLGIDPTEYTIDSQPTSPVIKRYADGGTLKQYIFVFGSREYYGPDTLQNLENSGFYEQFSDWVEQQSNMGNLPILSENRRPLFMEVLTTGYLFDASEDNARYQIQCRLVYYED